MEYTQLQKEYGGEFIAILQDKIIAHGKTRKEAIHYHGQDIKKIKITIEFYGA